MKNDTKLVLLAHDVGQFGGQERALEEFVLEASRSGQDVHVVAFRVSERVRRVASVTLIPRLPGPFFLRFLWLLLSSTIALVPFRKDKIISCGALTLGRVDAIWMHLWHSEHLKATKWFCAWPGDLLKFVSQSLSRALAYLAEAWAMHVVTPGLIVAVSESQGRALRGSYPLIPVVILPNPVRVGNHSVTAPNADTGKRISFVGGQWGHKGLVEVARAASNAAKNRSLSIELTIVGPGRSAVTQQLSRLPGIRICHIRWSDDVPSLIRGSDLFAMASRHETFSMAGHEALALGIPVITTDVHGLGDAVRGSGLGRTTMRTVPALARAIDEILWDNPPTVDQRSEAADWMAAHYGEEALRSARSDVLSALMDGAAVRVSRRNGSGTK